MIDPAPLTHCLVTDAGKGRKHELKDGQSVIIGSSRKATIQVTGSGVAERHAMVEQRYDGPWAISLAEGAELQVNGHRVRSTRTLIPGDRIVIGDGSCLIFDTAMAAPKRGDSKPFFSASRKPLLYLLGASYLLVILSVASWGLSKPKEKPLAFDTVQQSLQDTRQQLEQADFLKALAMPGKLPAGRQLDPGMEPAADYYQLLALASGDPGARRRVTDQLMARVEAALFRAWAFERQQRWRQAAEEYRNIQAMAPDIRLPAIRFSQQREKQARERIPAASGRGA